MQTLLGSECDDNETLQPAPWASKIAMPLGLWVMETVGSGWGELEEGGRNGNSMGPLQIAGHELKNYNPGLGDMYCMNTQKRIDVMYNSFTIKLSKCM